MGTLSETRNWVFYGVLACLAMAVGILSTVALTPSDGSASTAESGAVGVEGPDPARAGSTDDAEADYYSTDDPKASYYEMMSRANQTGLLRVGSAWLGRDSSYELFVPTEWWETATDGESVEIVDKSGVVVGYYVMYIGPITVEEYNTPGFSLRDWALANAGDREVFTQGDEAGGYGPPASFQDYVDLSTADFEGAWES